MLDPLSIWASFGAGGRNRTVTSAREGRMFKLFVQDECRFAAFLTRKSAAHTIKETFPIFSLIKYSLEYSIHQMIESYYWT